MAWRVGWPLQRQFAATRAEPGSTSFRVLLDGEPGEFFTFSGWRDEAALRAHYRTDHYLRYRSLVGPLLARPSDVTVLHVSQTVHPRDPNLPDPDLLG
ncbi:putative quinol monooxygenase [Patulibacter sp. NPDC049589]|uniref:putative quinol monooxygenase n=1 Tax=Patulibacter sp. NPDC049589 TaxID=3154731 RepID=UPI003444A2BF